MIGEVGVVVWLGGWAAAAFAICAKGSYEKAAGREWPQWTAGPGWQGEWGLLAVVMMVWPAVAGAVVVHGLARLAMAPFRRAGLRQRERAELLAATPEELAERLEQGR